MNMVTSYAKYSQAAPLATIQIHERNVQYINLKQWDKDPHVRMRMPPWIKNVYGNSWIV